MADPDQEEAGASGAAHNENDLVLPDENERIVPALEQLPAAQRRVIIQEIRSQLSHSGPLPPPEQLGQYEQIMPGLAERIVRLTEREQEHRHDVVTFAVKRNARLKERGQALGMAALALVLLFCVYLVAVGSPKIAGIVAVGLVAAVIGIFVTGRRADAKELEQDQPDEE